MEAYRSAAMVVKMIEVNFTMYFGQDNKLEVEAEVSSVVEQCEPSLDHPGAPAEGGEVEIISCYLM